MEENADVNKSLAAIQKQLVEIQRIQANSTPKKTIQFTNRPHLQQQFDLNREVMEKIQSIITTIEDAKKMQTESEDVAFDLDPETILAAARDAFAKLKERNKDILIAEQAQDGFKAVERYRQSGKIGDDDADEKAIREALKPPKADEQAYKRPASGHYGPPAKFARGSFVRFRGQRPPFRGRAPGYGAGYGNFQAVFPAPPMAVQPFFLPPQIPPTPRQPTPSPSGGSGVPKPTDQCRRCNAYGHWQNYGCPYPPGYNGIY